MDILFVHNGYFGFYSLFENYKSASESGESDIYITQDLHKILLNLGFKPDIVNVDNVLYNKALEYKNYPLNGLSELANYISHKLIAYGTLSSDISMYIESIVMCQEATFNQIIENWLNGEYDTSVTEKAHEDFDKLCMDTVETHEDFDKLCMDNDPKYTITQDELYATEDPNCICETSVDKFNLADYRSRQLRCYTNKLKHGFNVTDFHKEARFILKELSELMDAIEHNDVENMIEELGDIVIFCYGIAEMAHKDLDTQVFKKMAINESRKYTRNYLGDFVKEE